MSHHDGRVLGAFVEAYGQMEMSSNVARAVLETGAFRVGE